MPHLTPLVVVLAVAMLSVFPRHWIRRWVAGNHRLH
jgi:hypothetical protein